MLDETDELVEIVKSELTVKAVAGLEDAVKVELEIKDPEKDKARAMLENA